MRPTITPAEERQSKTPTMLTGKRVSTGDTGDFSVTATTYEYYGATQARRVAHAPAMEMRILQ